MQSVAAFTYPLRFTASSANPASIVALAGANMDEPGMFWAGATTSYLVLDLGAVTSLDTVALLGTNLRAGDTWQYRFGTDAGGINGYDSGTLPAFVGFKLDGNRADCISYLNTPASARYVRIDVTSSGNPDGFAMIQRVVVGTSVRAAGVDYDAEKYQDDNSIVTSGAGYNTVDEFPIYPGWKVNLAWIDETTWRQGFEPLFAQVGMSRGVLFVPDTTTPELWQSDAIFGRIVSKPTGKAEFYNGWSTAPTIEAISPKARQR